MNPELPLIDDSTTTALALEHLLPEDLRGRVETDLLAEAPSAAALRLLCTLRDQRWAEHVYAARIDWAAMLRWSRGTTVSNTVAVRVEMAASLGGYWDARPSLLAAATALDGDNFAAFLDALLIAREGLRG